jgi:4a-hydroxytetrahydrobiopterin dehydratase
MKALSELEIAEFTSIYLKDWAFGKTTINRDFKFKTFAEAFSFMSEIALEAEKLNHHPDWSNSYNKVYISLTNHEVNGVTQLDFVLANRIDKIFNKFQSQKANQSMS